MLRPQVFQEVMTNQQFMTCDYCQTHSVLRPASAEAGRRENGKVSGLGRGRAGRYRRSYV